MPSFATKDGFVVTPAKTPSLYAFFMSSRFAVSIKKLHDLFPPFFKRQ